MTCQTCGQPVDSRCGRCVELAPIAAYRAWLALLDADQAAGRGLLVKAP